MVDRLGRFLDLRFFLKIWTFVFRKNGLLISELAMMAGTVICFGVRFIQNSTIVPFALLYFARVLMQSFEVWSILVYLKGASFKILSSLFSLLLNFFKQASWIAGSIYTLELVGPSKRGLYGCIFLCQYCAGWIYSAFGALIGPDWGDYTIHLLILQVKFETYI